MSSKKEDIVDLIYKKLKNYNSKEINLEKEDLGKFIFTLFEENKDINQMKPVIIDEILGMYNV